MKEWALRHPVLTFLIATSAIDGAIKIAYSLIQIFGGEEEAKEEEKTE